MANITDKTVKSKYPPKDTNVTWIDTSSKPYVSRSYINGSWEVVGGGVTDYEDIKNKPTINGVELDGNKTSSDLGVATSQQGAKADTAYQKPSSGIPESDLSSDVQQALQKHFKGWYNTLAELKAEHTAIDGDSAYVKDASPATTWSIYVYDSTASSDNYWADSGTDADTSNVQTFASSQEVNDVHIVNDLTTGGTEDVLSAEQGKVINAILNGATEDLNVTPTTAKGYYYNVNNVGGVDTLIVSSGASINYSGQVSGTGQVTPTNGVDVSDYIGKTLRVIVKSSGTTPSESTRQTLIISVNGSVVSHIGENGYTQDTDDLHIFYYDFVLTEGAKWFFYSGTRALVSVVVIDGFTSTGLIDRVDELEQLMPDISLTIELDSPKAKILQGNDYIEVATNYAEARVDDAGATLYDSNPLFNFYSMIYNGITLDSTFKDDIAPAHFLGQTLGANHGQPCKKATITGHGLDNTAIGTAWVQNSVNFYVMNIIDENTVVFLSANSGTAVSPSWTSLAEGTLTDGNTTLTVTSVADYQLHPSIDNEDLKIFVDGKEVTEDGIYHGNVIDFVESYDIMNPTSVLSNTIARAGQSEDAKYIGDAAAHIENTYRFVKGLTVLVISNFTAMQEIQFQDIMFSQAMLKGTNGQIKYYIPNSKPFGSYDLSQPLTMTWGSVDNIFTNNSHTKDETKPINRVLQYGASLGYALGFLTDRGVGQSLSTYTNNTSEVRGTSGKIYPHGVDNKVGTTLQAGKTYSAVMYRSMFIPESSGNRLSMYHFNLNGVEYVFADYKGSLIDNIVVDNSLNGKKVTVLEAINVELLTDMYNQGFRVSATYTSGEGCYIIAKISYD